MSHCGHDHGHNHTDTRRLLTALAVIVVFFFVEVAGGIISGSLALLADAAHMGTDALALALAASAHWFSTRPPGPKLHFGYQRAQVLAAFVNGVALIGVLFWIVYEAISRFFTPVDVAWQPMLIVAFLGLLANGAAFAILHQGNSDNINVRGAMLHVVSDLLGSVVAVIAAITVATSGWNKIDPLLSIVVAALIARSAFRLLRETSHILLEGAPDHIKIGDVVEELHNANIEIEDIHNVQIWQLTPNDPRITLHARLSQGQDPQTALVEMKERLHQKFGIQESTIQIEFGNDCPYCTSPTNLSSAPIIDDNIASVIPDPAQPLGTTNAAFAPTK